MILEYVVVEGYLILFSKLCPGIRMINRDCRSILVFLEKVVNSDYALTHSDRIIIISLFPKTEVALELVYSQTRTSRGISLWHVGNREE